MQITALDIWHLRIPFSLPVKHSLAVRGCSECLIFKVTTDSGITGFGEGTPREYVTGETVEANLVCVKEHLWPQLKNAELDNNSGLLRFVSGMASQELAATNPSAVCAIEMSLLDAAGRLWDKPAFELLGLQQKSSPLLYSAVIPMLPLETFAMYMELVKQRKMNFLKLKVGGNSDLACLNLAREILGTGIDIRVDANCAWSPDEAIKEIRAMEPFQISAVEQPVPKEDFAGLKQVSENVGIPVIADESCCTLGDAAQLATMRACSAFNVRLSKCGGFINSLAIMNLARSMGIKIVIGCHVGETGILSAGGRHIAQCTEDLMHLEGSFSSWLFREDVIEGDITFGIGGAAPPLLGPGLGVDVAAEVLNRYVVEHFVLQNV